jgi:hypothetical protein
MRTFQHPNNGEHAVARETQPTTLLADGWVELDAEASESEAEPSRARARARAGARAQA